MTNTIHPLRLEGLERYAKADKSDPFTLRRALCHMRNGVAGFTVKGEDAFYDAVEDTEERITADGKPFVSVVYRNRVRP